MLSVCPAVYFLRQGQWCMTGQMLAGDHMCLLLNVSAGPDLTFLVWNSQTGKSVHEGKICKDPEPCIHCCTAAVPHQSVLFSSDSRLLFPYHGTVVGALTYIQIHNAP